MFGANVSEARALEVALEASDMTQDGEENLIRIIQKLQKRGADRNLSLERRAMMHSLLERASGGKE